MNWPFFHRRYWKHLSNRFRTSIQSNCCCFCFCCCNTLASNACCWLLGVEKKRKKRKRQNLLNLRPFSISKTLLQQSIVLTFPFFPFSLLVYLNHSLSFFFLFLLITIPFACCTVCWHCLFSFFFSSLFRRRTVSHSTTVSFIGSFSHCFSFWPCYSFSFFCISLPAINRKVYR